MLLAAAAGFVWLAWPVSLWVVGAFLLHWLLRTAAERLENDRKLGLRGLLRATAEVAAHTLSHCIVSVGFGIFLVGVAQAVLWAGSNVIEPGQVRMVEEKLSWSYQKLLDFLDLHTLAWIMGALVLVAFLAPRLDVVGRFLKLKSFLTRVAFVLLGATSFTFFGALDLELVDPEWRAAERYQAHATFAAINEHTRDMTAAAWIEAETRRLDQTKKQEFVHFFDTARRTRYPVQIVRAAATELAQKAPKVSDAKAATPSDGVISDRVRKYLQGEDTEIHLPKHEQPSLAEVRAANERLSGFELRVRAARSAAIELASEAIAEIVKGDKELIKEFVQELTSTLSKGALHEVVPSKVADIASAKDWVKVHMFGAPMVDRAIAQPWAFNPSSLEPKAAGGGVRASEAAVAALVTRLNAEQIARRQAATALRNSRINFPSTPRPIETPHFRFRR
jgi:hypothetical protein